ncbi:hypothetical protein [Pseudomonas syringae]|uniref:hypothetical protein n=1 Tax=Pseudomonas syringae TaxID=317 RepID=UPI001F27333A|nr:hypothetical protein [Pseudomonas syringae]
MIADSRKAQVRGMNEGVNSESLRKYKDFTLATFLKCMIFPALTATAVTGCSYGLTQKGLDNSQASKTVTVNGSARQIYQSLAQEMKGPGCPPIHSSQLYGNGDGFVVYFGENFIGHSYIWDGAYGKQEGNTVKVTIRDQSYTPQTDFVDEIATFLKTGSCK